MPPKKAGADKPSKKTEMKKKEKVIEVSESVLVALPKYMVSDISVFMNIRSNHWW